MKADPAPWASATVVCIASGPSLTLADVAAVQAWRNAPEPPQPRRVVVANTSFLAAPWADALFAMDAKWWKVHWAEVAATFQGHRYSTAPLPINYGVQRLGRGRFQEYRNSGAGCVSLAAHLGAATVLLLGFDCRHAADGRTHWHGSHPAGLGDAVSVARWPAKFAELARAMKPRLRVVNCSRDTALDCFERGALEEFLHP